MNWAFAVIGFIVGGIAALIGDFSAANGALLGAAVGFCIGHALQQRKRKHTSATPDAFAMPATTQPPPATLADRVARLEATVETLTRELDSLRGQLAGAKAAANATGTAAQSPSSGLAGTPSAPLPPMASATQPKPPAQPAVAHASMPASTSAPAPAAPTTAARTQDAPAARATANAPATPPRTAPPVPREPGIAERAFSAARDWLLGGNTVVRVGIVVLFFGVAFLLKYAADNNMLP
ncbi:DUF2339 domain-containing protein, partial [Burkholderia stabilis]